jgi:hypothetical protein
MRLWSLHPRYLDAKGLVALWREGLLAQKVLAGRTTGYRHHPQLSRFRARPDAQAAIASYLLEVWKEAQRRGYRFDAGKVAPCATNETIEVTRGQLVFELGHLRAKLRLRDSVAFHSLDELAVPKQHPLFKVVSGAVEEWEVVPRK